MGTIKHSSFIEDSKIASEKLMSLDSLAEDNKVKGMAASSVSPSGSSASSVMDPLEEQKVLFHAGWVFKSH